MPPAANDMNVQVPTGIRVQKVLGGMDKIQDGGDGGYGLYADASFKKGEVVYKYPSEPWPRDRSVPEKLADTVDLHLFGPSLPPDGLTVRITPSEHGELYADGTVEISGFDMICNHCCDANMYYDEENSTTVAARDIQVGEELTVNYNCHNWDETSNLLTFDCANFCKTPHCCRTVNGFKYLSPERQQQLADQGGCSEYVLQQWNQAKASLSRPAAADPKPEAARAVALPGEGALAELRRELGELVEVRLTAEVQRLENLIQEEARGMLESLVAKKGEFAASIEHSVMTTVESRLEESNTALSSEVDQVVSALNSRINYTNKDLAAMQDGLHVIQNSLQDVFDEVRMARSDLTQTPDDASGGSGQREAAVGSRELSVEISRVERAARDRHDVAVKAITDLMQQFQAFMRVMGHRGDPPPVQKARGGSAATNGLAPSTAVPAAADPTGAEAGAQRCNESAGSSSPARSGCAGRLCRTAWRDSSRNPLPKTPPHSKGAGTPRWETSLRGGELPLEEGASSSHSRRPAPPFSTVSRGSAWDATPQGGFWAPPEHATAINRGYPAHGLDQRGLCVRASHNIAVPPSALPLAVGAAQAPGAVQAPADADAAGGAAQSELAQTSPAAGRTQGPGAVQAPAGAGAAGAARAAAADAQAAEPAKLDVAEPPATPLEPPRRAPGNPVTTPPGSIFLQNSGSVSSFTDEANRTAERLIDCVIPPGSIFLQNSGSVSSFTDEANRTAERLIDCVIGVSLQPEHSRAHGQQGGRSSRPSSAGRAARGGSGTLPAGSSLAAVRVSGAPWR